MTSTCSPNAAGVACPPSTNWASCRPWDITEQDKTNCFMDNAQNESLSIAGAIVNVFKLLGVHEQTKLVDIAGTGEAISGGSAPNYPASNAFNTTHHVWKSKQVGLSSITSSSYIGYDFGQMKLPNGRRKYGIDAPNIQLINSIAIKQSSKPEERVGKVRIERSEDGKSWYGVAVVALPDDDKLNRIHFKDSVPSRWWRIRPVAGTSTPIGSCDSWVVQAIELYNYQQTEISNIQDKILLENRNRDYSTEPQRLKGFYTAQAVQSDLSRFGIEIPSAGYTILVNFNSCVALLGRPIVVGDIIELPSELQYTPDLKPIKRYLEVTDVAWDPSSYTPGWMPTMLSIQTTPAVASEETQDIFGDLAAVVDSSGVFSTDDGNDEMYQDFSAVDQTIAAVAKKQVPERGSEGSNTVREFTPEEIKTASDEGYPALKKMNFNRTGAYVEDAIPQNGAPYTESDVLPTTAANGAYHRLIYTGLAKDIPARLFRWSEAKNKWIYLETDRRQQFNNQKAMLEEYTTSPHKQWVIDRKL